MRFEDLDAQTLDQIGTPEDNAQARTLVQNHQVQHGYRLPDRLRGVVLDEQPFQVEVRIQDDQLTYVCSCPQVEGDELCAHVLALLAGLDRGTGEVSQPGGTQGTAEEILQEGTAGHHPGPGGPGAGSAGRPEGGRPGAGRYPGVHRPGGGGGFG